MGKIELDHKLDLEYVIGTLKDVAAKTLDSNKGYKLSGDKTSEKQNKVTSMLEDIFNNIHGHIRSNILVNGIEGDDSTDDNITANTIHGNKFATADFFLRRSSFELIEHCL